MSFSEQNSGVCCEWYTMDPLGLWGRKCLIWEAVIKEASGSILIAVIKVRKEEKHKSTKYVKQPL